MKQLPKVDRVTMQAHVDQLIRRGSLLHRPSRDCRICDAIGKLPLEDQQALVVNVRRR